MPQQSNLFSSSPANGSTVQVRQPAPQPPRLPVWLRRIELYLYVIIRIYIGIIVLVLPWYTPLWADNELLNYYPRVGTFLMYGSVRGMISGLGLLNLWIAVEEAIHFRTSAS